MQLFLRNSHVHRGFSGALHAQLFQEPLKPGSACQQFGPRPVLLSRSPEAALLLEVKTEKPSGEEAGTEKGRASKEEKASNVRGHGWCMNVHTAHSRNCQCNHADIPELCLA